MQIMHSYLNLYASNLTIEEREKYFANDFFMAAKAKEIESIENSLNNRCKREALDFLKRSNSFYNFVELWEAVSVPV